MPATNEWRHTLRSFKHLPKISRTHQSPRGENVCADALAALGSRLRDQVKRTIPIHKIDKPSIDLTPTETAIVAPITEATPANHVFEEVSNDTNDWRTEFIYYLVDGKLPPEK